MKLFDSDDETFVGLVTEEEARLMKKFNDYVNLEKRIAKHRLFETSDERISGKFAKKFIVSSMVQGAILTGLIMSLLLNQALLFNGDLPAMLQFSFIDNHGIFFFGFILQICLTVGLALIGLFYNHVESNLNRGFFGKRKTLAFVHLFGLNIFGIVITMSLMLGGIATSDLYQTLSPSLLHIIPPTIYISAILFVMVLTAGIIGLTINFIKPSQD